MLDGQPQLLPAGNQPLEQPQLGICGKQSEDRGGAGRLGTGGGGGGGKSSKQSHTDSTDEAGGKGAYQSLTLALAPAELLPASHPPRSAGGAGLQGRRLHGRGGGDLHTRQQTMAVRGSAAGLRGGSRSPHLTGNSRTFCLLVCPHKQALVLF